MKNWNAGSGDEITGSGNQAPMLATVLLFLVFLVMQIYPLPERAAQVVLIEKIDTSSAGTAELMSLKGIGPKRAEKIISLREKGALTRESLERAVGSRVFQGISSKIRY